ncbi:hypothetical protein ACN27E_03530 [Mycobacterium sp. WMMD1722]|uniref:hypothetical protein n=1 Tax=Mycobacterium sp. WMMD1722 TaxID=3404117 RepID=UPI003BF4D360
MAVQIRSGRTPSDRSPVTGAARADHRLALLDQAFYEGHRAAGQREVMQVGWVYERAVDLDHLELFRTRLAQGLLGRLIERSPLPFGRHRWVRDPHPPGLDISLGVRPRSALTDWFDECTQLPIDPESGPGWRISVTPLADGATAVSLVLSHYVIDGIGAAIAVTEALMNLPRPLDYPPPRSRAVLPALAQDLGETLRDAPSVGRALSAAAREARRRARDAERSHPAPTVAMPTAGSDDPVIAPSAWVRIPLDEWSACAERLGGTAGTLAAAFTAKLDERMGRTHGTADGVSMLLTVNDRTTADDARAIAVKFIRVGIDPTTVTGDLRSARAAVKQALKAAQETPDEAADLVALTPFTPARGWRQLAEYALNDPEQPAVCSNLGDTGPAAIRPDGTLCDVAFARGASQHLTGRRLERIGSQLHVYYGTAMEINLVTIYLCGFQPATVSTKADLRGLTAQVLDEFNLSGDIE